ncbi:MAG: hypothetical protein ABJE47_02770 [bacterium]
MTSVATDATLARQRAAWLLPVVIVAVAAAVTSWAVAPYLVGVFHDDGVYALLAQSIASGHGFHYSHLPGAPAATHYPPLYPLLLAAAWRISPDFPENVTRLLALNVVFISVAALGCWHFTAAQLAWSRRPAAVASLVATLASPTLALASALLSESLFLALLWPALVASEQTVASPHRPALRTTGLLIGVLMLARTHAVAVAIALLLALALRRRWRDALTLAAWMECVQLPWQLWSHWATPPVVTPLQGSYGSYLGWFASGVRAGGPPFVLATARTNVAECWLLLRDRLVIGASEPLVSMAAAITLIAIIAGAASFWRKAPVTILFVACYVVILLAWPYAPWRFLWCIWPLVLLLAFEGVRTLFSASSRWRIAVAVGAALPALAVLRTELHSYATRAWRTPALQASAQIAPALAWVRAHTAGSDVVLVEGEQVVALYTGRHAAPPISFSAAEYLFPPDVKEGTARLSAMLAAVPARYAILFAPAMISAANSLEGSHPGMRRVEMLPDGVAYEVVP